eukprot:3171480-Lingulodinium_polyedra.AAC.1
MRGRRQPERTVCAGEPTSGGESTPFFGGLQLFLRGGVRRAARPIDRPGCSCESGGRRPATCHCTR